MTDSMVGLAAEAGDENAATKFKSPLLQKMMQNKKGAAAGAKV